MKLLKVDVMVALGPGPSFPHRHKEIPEDRRGSRQFWVMMRDWLGLVVGSVKSGNFDLNFQGFVSTLSFLNLYDAIYLYVAWSSHI